MKHAWDGYKLYAWGHDELMPLAKRGTTSLGSVSLALTMIDSLDTLMLMNMQEEFIEARNYILEQVNFDQVNDHPLSDHPFNHVHSPWKFPCLKPTFVSLAVF